MFACSVFEWALDQKLRFPCAPTPYFASHPMMCQLIPNCGALLRHLRRHLIENERIINVEGFRGGQRKFLDFHHKVVLPLGRNDLGRWISIIRPRGKCLASRITSVLALVSRPSS